MGRLGRKNDKIKGLAGFRRVERGSGLCGVGRPLFGGREWDVQPPMWPFNKF